MDVTRRRHVLAAIGLAAAFCDDATPLQADAPATMTPGVAYHAPTDARSWIAMQSFFAELFGNSMVTERPPLALQ